MSRIAILILLFILRSAIVHGQQDSVNMHYNVDDVVITAHKQFISSIDDNGNVSINIDAITSIPRLGGAIDIVKLLQYTPGVAATQEGNTALYVRGGDAGQSRITINGVPLFAPSHLLGFFSVLNSAHLSGLTLYKSGIPAIYGSSTTSITEIRTHSYIPNKTVVDGNIGLIESDAAIQIPISQRNAIFLSARHSYASWLTNLINVNDTAMRYEFGDYGIGFTSNLGKVGQLSMNTHFNSDHTSAYISLYNSNGKLKWWNGLGNITLESKIGERITM